MGHLPDRFRAHAIAAQLFRRPGTAVVAVSGGADSVALLDLPAAADLALVARIRKPEFLAGIRTPVLLASPGREMVVSPAAQRRAARLLPDCTLVELPQSKHDPFLEHDRVRAYWFSCIDRFIAERLVKTAH